MTAFTATGFRQFMDRVMMHGLEWMGLYYGTYRAVVVDRRPDDNTQGKIVVRVPAIDGPTTSVMRTAYPIAPIPAGAFGIKSLPPDDGFVYVEFENGRPDIPLWKGGWWLTDQMPEDLQHADAHGWFTAGGHQLLMSEESGSETFRLRHLSGAEIVIDSDGNINITHTGSTVTVGGGTTEKAMNGETTKEIISDILTEIIQLQVITTTGPSSPPKNAPAFVAIKARLSTTLSDAVKVAK